MTKQDFMKLKIKNLLIQQPHDVNVQGNASHARFHQLPVNAKLVSVDSVVLSTDDEVQSAIRHKQSFTCSFTLPNSPPALPDFVVLRSDQYKEQGGPNIMGFPGGENLIPIPVSKMTLEKQRKRPGQCNDTLTGARIGAKLESALVRTPYKIQGSEFERMIVDDYDFVHIPGIWLVNNTRVKDAKHLCRLKYPIAADIQVQRLQNPFVIEAEIYERREKIKSCG